MQKGVITAWFSINLNGSLVEYFHSERKLRQGEPISLYLFLLVVEVFTQLIRKNVEEMGFDYHPKCKELLLTHITFADNLFLLARATELSFKMLKQTLDEFGGMLGLRPNLMKSSIFLLGLGEVQSEALCKIMQMPKSKLIVRYLGVPLITFRLSLKGCQSNLDKMQTKIREWIVKTLSHGGRLQLVKFVLNSIQAYWSSIFILPKKLIKKIEGLMATFLWLVEAKTKYQAKVSWIDACSEVKESGLGLLNVEFWNKILVAKQIWNICQKKNSLWIKCVYSIMLKGRNFWAMQIPGDCSWQ